MENKEFKKKTLELIKREEIKVSKQCTNIFKNSQEFRMTLISNDVNDKKLVINELLSKAGEKFESLV